MDNFDNYNIIAPVITLDVMCGMYYKISPRLLIYAFTAVKINFSKICLIKLN